MYTTVFVEVYQCVCRSIPYSILQLIPTKLHRRIVRQLQLAASCAVCNRELNEIQPIKYFGAAWLQKCTVY